MPLPKNALPYEIFYRLGIHRITWHRDAPVPEVAQWFDAGVLAGRTALEVGCGLASNALWLAKRGLRATAIDFSPRAVALAARRAETLRVPLETRVVDVTVGEPSIGPFDVVVDCECLQDLATPELRQAYAASMRRWLAPGGALVIVTWLARDEDEAKRFFPLSRLREQELLGLFPGYRFEEQRIRRQRYVGVLGWHGVFRVRAPAD